MTSESGRRHPLGRADTGRQHPPGRPDVDRAHPSSSRRRRASGAGQQAGAEAPDVVFEVRLLDGPEGEALAPQQARVLREVTEWLARNSSDSGQAQAR
jgi:hypothetical protein